MDKFKEELKKEKNPWIKRIGEYLLSREDVHENLKKEKKSLKECFDYILIELSKKCTKEGNVGYVAGDDEEIFGMAVHYYDEDDIKVGKKNFKTNADGSAAAKRLNKASQTPKEKEKTKVVVKEKVVVDQEAINKAVASALDDYKREEQEKKRQKAEEAKKKKEEAKAKKEAEKDNNGQINLFEIIGDENE